MKKRTSIVAFAACTWAATFASASKVWQADFNSGADGVVDLFDQNSAKALIGPVSGGKLQITQMDNVTNAYTPDKAGKPLGATIGGNSSFSAMYQFRWTGLNQVENQAYTMTGFLGNASPQTRQVFGTIIKHWKVDADYYVSVDCAVGSVGATDFGYMLGNSTWIGTSPQTTDFRLAMGYDGTTHVYDFGLYDTAGNRLTGQTLDLDTDVPGLQAYAGAAAELGAFALTHLGWEDYSGNLTDQAIISQVDSMAYWDDATGGILAAATPAGGGTSNWAVDANGAWSVATNWAGGIPNSVGATAGFGTIITSQRSIDVDGGFTVGALDFSSATSYTLGGAGSLTLDVSSGNAAISVSAGSHTVNVPLNLADSSDIQVATGTNLTLSKDILGTSGTAVTKSGAGAVNIKSVRAGALSVNGGTITVLANGTAAGTSKVTSLSISSGATVDLTNNALVIDHTGASAEAGLRPSLQSAYHSGGWDGAGLTSAFANGSSGPVLAIGVAEAADLGLPPTFGGISIDGDATLLRLTASGDANLDGKVNTLDFNNLAGGFGGAGRWFTGDFNYDGVVNSADFSILAANYGQTAPSSGSALGATVPEPASALIFAGLAALLTRQRTRRRL
jgi:hypothetical protein